MAEQYAPRLALIAVSAVLCRGMLGGGDFAGTVQTAAAAGVAFFALGLLVGEIARRLVEEQVRAAAASGERPATSKAGPSA